MSGQQSQRVRRNVSPGASVKQGPIKATVPVALMQTCSPTRCLNQIASPADSPPAYYQNDAPKNRKRNSPDNRISPETQSPPPSGLKVEKSKALTKSVSPASYIRRTASVDTIYLLGQWQRDALYLSYCGRLMMDRATQTPEEFEEVERKPQKKTSSPSGETLEMKFIRQRLQRTNQNSRGTGPPSYQRCSPVHGDHSAISSASGGNTSPVVPSSTAISPQRLLSHTTTTFAANPAVASNNASATYSTFAAASSSARALPIPIPDIPKPLIPRMRSSVEGLNQEIERLVLKEISSIEGTEVERTLDPTPEGHRAPIADLFRTTQSVDTQTPFSQRDSCQSSISPASRSSSISPVIPGQMDTSRPSSAEDISVTESPEGDSLNKLATSPHINKFLAREPPDGCEKVKIAEETRNSVCLVEPQEYGCPKPSLNFVLLPSQSSAFYPLCKECVMSTSEDCHSASSLSSPGGRLQ